MTQSQISINENRLFSKVKRYFNGVDDAIYETIQNAFRANMPAILNGERPNLHITANGREFVVQDFGVGVADIGKCLSVAESDWDEVTDRLSDPAGMGICALLAASDTVKVTSLFGSLVIESDKFFDDPEYRTTLIDHIQTDEFCSVGTLVQATLKQAISDSRVRHICRWMLDLDITINGAPFKIEHGEKKLFDFTVPGCDETLTFYSQDPLGQHYASTACSVIWQGKSMQIPCIGPVEVEIDGAIVKTSVTEIMPRGSYVVLPSRVVNLVTPRLPARDCLVEDDKTRTFVTALLTHMTLWFENSFNAFLEEAEKNSHDRKGMLKTFSSTASRYLSQAPKDLIDHHLRKRGLKCVKKYHFWEGDSGCPSWKFVWLDADEPVHCLDEVVIFLGKDEQGNITKMFQERSCDDHVDTDIVLGPSSEFMSNCVRLGTIDKGYRVEVGRPSAEATRQVLIVEVPENYLLAQQSGHSKTMVRTVKVCPEMRISTASLHENAFLSEDLYEGPEAVDAWNRLQEKMKDLKQLPDQTIALGFSEDYDFYNCLAFGTTEEKLCDILDFSAELAKEIAYSADDNVDEIREDVENTLHQFLTDVTGSLHVGSALSDIIQLLGENTWQRTVSAIEVDMREKSIKWTLADGTQKQQSFVDG